MIPYVISFLISHRNSLSASGRTSDVKLNQKFSRTTHAVSKPTEIMGGDTLRLHLTALVLFTHRLVKVVVYDGCTVPVMTLFYGQRYDTLAAWFTCR
uniref:Uncharacterized protein n=1 Tax=Oryza brachyantha TaxID=4533 RepID=J3MMF4_ORYBR